MTHELHRSLAARAENLGAIRAAVEDLCERLDLEDGLADDVRLAVSEACANVVMHAYREGPQGDMEIEADPEDGELVVTVRDTGPGIKPRFGSPGAGLGLPLIAALAARVEVRRRRVPCATELVMHFPLRRRRHMRIVSG